MYCRTCGQDVSEQAVFCIHCGVPPSKGAKYCYNCKAETDPNAIICVKCGAEFKRLGQKEGYDWLTTLLLCFFFGTFGVHRFYTKNITTGVIQLVTLGACGIWTLIDLIMIITGSFKDGQDRPLVRKDN